jgi:hypothetical protein
VLLFEGTALFDFGVLSALGCRKLIFSSSSFSVRFVALCFLCGAL